MAENNIFESLKKQFHSDLFDEEGNLKWNSIDYTLKNWLQVGDTYFEIAQNHYRNEAGRMCHILTIGDSVSDLEDEYGEKYFPEEAVGDGKTLLLIHTTIRIQKFRILSVKNTTLKQKKRFRNFLIHPLKSLILEITYPVHPVQLQ